MQFGMEEIKLSLYADDKVIYINDLKNSMRKVLQLINTLIKIAGYKTNQKTLVNLQFTNGLRKISRKN